MAIGTIFTEIDLDMTKFEKKQRDLLGKIEEVGRQGEQALTRAFMNLGVTTDKVYQGMASLAVASYKRITDAGHASAAEQIRAKQSMIAKLNAMNAELANSPAFSALGIRSSAMIEAERASTMAWYKEAQLQAGLNGAELVRIEVAKNAKITALDNESNAVQIANDAKRVASAKAMEAVMVSMYKKQAAAAKEAAEAEMALSKTKGDYINRWYDNETQAHIANKKFKEDQRQADNAANAEYWNAKRKFEQTEMTKSQQDMSQYWLAKMDYDKKAKAQAITDADANYKTLGMRSAAAINEQKANIIKAAADEQAIKGKSSEDWIRIERAKNEKLKELNKEMTGSHEISLASMQRSLLRFYASMYVISSAVDYLSMPFVKGFKAVEEYNTAIASMAAMVVTFGQNIRGLSLEEQWKGALAYSTAIIPVLEKIAAKTLLSGQETIALANAFARSGVFLDANNAKQIDAFTKISNALPLMTQGQEITRQINTEVRSLMTGMNVQSSMMLITLREIDPQIEKHLAQWRATDTVLEHIGDLLKGFGPATEILEKQWQAVKTSLDTTVNQILRGAMKQSYEDIIALTQELDKWLQTNKKSIADTVDQLRATAKMLKIIYDTAPTGTFEAASMGIIGKILWGNKVGALMVAFTFVNAQLKETGNNLGALPKKAFDAWEAIKNIPTRPGPQEVTVPFMAAPALTQQEKVNLNVIKIMKAMDETILKNHKQSIAEYDKETKTQEEAFRNPGGGQAGASEDYINKYLEKRNILKEQQFNLDKKSNDAAKKAAEEQARLMEKIWKIQEDVSLSGLDGPRKAFEQNRIEAEKLRHELENTAGWNRLSKAQKDAAFSAIDSIQKMKDQGIVNTMVQKSREDNAKATAKETAETDKITEAYNKLMNTVAPVTDRTYEMAKATEVVTAMFEKGTPAWQEAIDKVKAYYAALDKKDADKITADVIAAAGKRLAAERSLYKDLKDISGLYYEGERAVIEDEANQRLTALINEKTSAKDAANYRIAIEAAKQNKLSSLSIEEAKRSNDIVGGWNAGLLEMSRNVITLGQVGYDALKTFAESSSSIIQSVLFDKMTGQMKSFADYWKSMWNSLFQTFASIVAKMLVQWALLKAGMSELNVAGLVGGAVVSGAGTAVAAEGMGVVLPATTGAAGASLGTQATTYTAGAGFSAGLNAALGGLQETVGIYAGNLTASALGNSAGAATGNAILGMSSAAFAGWTAGIGTFIMDMIQGKSFAASATQGLTTGAGAYAGGVLGSYVGPYGTAIGAVVGGLVGFVFGDLLGIGKDKGNTFTLTEQVNKEINSQVFEATKGFTALNTKATLAGPDNGWYLPIQNAYSASIETVQQSFNAMVFDFTSKLPAEMQNQILTELSNTDFGAMQMSVSGGRWDSGAAGDVIGSIAKQYAEGLATTLGNAYANALSDYIVQQGPGMLIGDDSVWKVLSDRVQANVNQMYIDIAKTIKGDPSTGVAADVAGGVTKLNDLAGVFNKISQAMDPIREIIETNGLTDYEKAIRSINIQFDGYAKTLTDAGIDLAKYTDFQTAKDIALANAATDAANATDGLVASLKNISLSITGWLNNLSLSDLSPVQSADNWSRQYAEAKAKASASGATEQTVNDYLSFATKYLEFQQKYGTATSYKAIYDAVVGDVSGIGTGANQALVIARQQLDALNLIALNTATANIIGSSVSTPTGATTTNPPPTAGIPTSGYGVESGFGFTWGQLQAVAHGEISALGIGTKWSGPYANDVDWATKTLDYYGIPRAAGGYADTPSIFGEAGGEWAVPTYEPQRKNFLKSAPKSFWDNLGLNGGSSSPDGGEVTVHSHIYLDGKEIQTCVSKGFKTNNDLIQSARRAVN